MNGRRKRLLQIAATCTAEIINIAQYLITKYKEHQFLNTFKSHRRNQLNTNSTIKTAASCRRIKPVE
jgi:predicted MarR family transcription regulator